MINSDNNQISYVRVVPMSWQERYEAYMELSKEQLATMLAEVAKYMFPQSCSELITYIPTNVEFYTTNTYEK